MNLRDYQSYWGGLILVAQGTTYDIETMFIIPWSISVSKLNLLGFWSMVDFIIELGLGFIYVWWVGALDWDFWD